jgi:Bacteriophage T4 gp9/10-like protein
MAKQLINLGTTANDHTGDSVRSAGTKINANINELYTALGNGTTLTVATVAKTGSYADLTGKPPTAPELVAPPLTSTSAGTTGQISWDANYIYICVNTNTWKRVALTTW